MNDLAASIPEVLAQHVEEAADLRRLRSTLVRMPRVRLTDLARLDERIAAHLDGVAASGAAGAALAKQAVFERPGLGEIFVATVHAIEVQDTPLLRQLLAISQTLLPARSGLLSALGWVSAGDLRGTARSLLDDPEPWLREAGLAACAMHQADPGAALVQALHDPEPGLRVRALRIAGQLGRRDLLSDCRVALADPDARCVREAARAAVLLGDRSDALSVLQSIATPADALEPGFAAWRVLLGALPVAHARSVLAVPARDLLGVRAAIHGITVVGDPHFVPWLIARMNDSAVARLAGDAFSSITGVDIAADGLECKPLLRPRSDPDAIDDDAPEPTEGDAGQVGEDDDLPWPDPGKVAAWWQSHASRFEPGRRYLMGQEPSASVCAAVLHEGTQRQRCAAAERLALLAPGTPLFNVAAPSWRQTQWLAKIVA